MPELPEVATVAAALDRVLPGLELADARFLGRLRRPFDPDAVKKALSGRVCTRVGRRAKYIRMEFGCEWGLLAHLGMTGSFRLENARQPVEKHDRIALLFANGQELRYADARRFGFVQLVRYPPSGGDPEELARLGPEPLGRGFTARAMLERAGGRRCPVKVFLMDQEVVAGVGNIYATEALFLAGVSPLRLAGEVGLGEWRRIVGETKKVLRGAIKAGGSTIRDYRGLDGGEGAFQRALRLYGRKDGRCPRCGTEIVTLRVGGRGTFYCPHCQT